MDCDENSITAYSAFLLINFPVSLLSGNANFVSGFIFPFIRTSQVEQEIGRTRIISTIFPLCGRKPNIFAGITCVLLKTIRGRKLRYCLKFEKISWNRVLFFLSTTSKRDWPRFCNGFWAISSVGSSKSNLERWVCKVDYGDRWSKKFLYLSNT